MLSLFLCLLAAAPLFTTAALQATSTPPLIDVPTYSVATLNEDGSTNMNILTYATPVSARPDRVWSLGLYKETLSYQNFVRNKSCVLQLLTEEHAPLIKLLGGTSGRDVDKRAECAKMGVKWMQDGSDADPEILPDCASYLKLSAMNDVIDCGSHAVALCRVDEMLVTGEDSSKLNLSTARLRELGIITEQGRVAD
jgi:flavin reductase (DIM6/NTAB) family NADH-FMN oxidoreductase RutF